jgi:DNA-binding transcriptional ArsR family regulator
MDDEAAIFAFAALAQGTRLEAFRVLVAAAPEGLPAGEIARRLAVPHNTLSSHLTILSRAGLIVSERRSRSIHYRADLDRVRTLATFLLENCCGGRPEVCGPLPAELAPCRPAAPPSRPET